MVNEYVIAQTNLFIKRGDCKNYTLYFEDDDGDRINITGWVLFFTVKTNIDDPDSAAKISKTITIHTDPINGESQIALSSIDTVDVVNYCYDIQYKTLTGSIKTIVEGYVTISKDVTQRISQKMYKRKNKIIYEVFASGNTHGFNREMKARE